LTHPSPHTKGSLDLESSRAEFAADVQFYLTQNPRQLPSRYLYDELGSALFEAITRLPWYPLTRAESRLLAAHGDDILGRMQPLETIVELGPGSGEKLRLLLEAAQSLTREPNLHLVDVSERALVAATAMLASSGDFSIVTHQASYETGLRAAVRQMQGRGRTLVLLLGSNIGNFDPPAAEAFLRGICANLAEGDALLIGADGVKPERELLLAYDDPLGISAAFNRNILLRINRELGGNFVLEQFAHRVIWNAADSRMEMHLVARSPQQVHIEAAHLDLGFGRDEPIWTESSYKYRPADIARLLERTGFAVSGQWIDDADGFVLTLAGQR
jgi:L-histidine N-alpha-methyltransferase